MKKYSFNMVFPDDDYSQIRVKNFKLKHNCIYPYSYEQILTIKYNILADSTTTIQHIIVNEPNLILNYLNMYQLITLTRTNKLLRHYSLKKILSRVGKNHCNLKHILFYEYIYNSDITEAFSVFYNRNNLHILNNAINICARKYDSRFRLQFNGKECIKSFFTYAPAELLTSIYNSQLQNKFYYHIDIIDKLKISKCNFILEARKRNIIFNINYKIFCEFMWTGNHRIFRIFKPNNFVFLNIMKKYRRRSHFVSSIKFYTICVELSYKSNCINWFDFTINNLFYVNSNQSIKN
jgi:hypothetical protein